MSIQSFVTESGSVYLINKQGDDYFLTRINEKPVLNRSDYKPRPDAIFVEEPLDYENSTIKVGHPGVLFIPEHEGKVLTTSTIKEVVDGRIRNERVTYDFRPTNRETDIHDCMSVDRSCGFCGVKMRIHMDAEHYMQYVDPNGPHVQHIFTHLNPHQRDVLITGICVDCQVELGV